MKGILYKSKEGWMVKYTTYKTIPGIKGIMGSHSRMPESNYLPVHPDTKLYPDGLWGQAKVDDFETVDFEIVEVIAPVEDGTTIFKCAKLINEEKHTKRRQKKFTNIMEHNHIKRMYTEDDLLDAMSFAECYIMEHDKPLFLKSNGKPTPDCLNFINSLNK
jgi:hypothetical protein